MSAIYPKQVFIPGMAYWSYISPDVSLMQVLRIEVGLHQHRHDRLIRKAWAVYRERMGLDEDGS